MEKNNRILIVDDQQDLREQLAKLLRRSGKKNETTSFVQSMRERLTGVKKEDSSKNSDSPDTYNVDVAAQGQDAFEMVTKALAENKPYSLLFTDMRMPPGWDGLETAKKIREIDKNIEIVIMTAFADHDQATIAERIGTPEKLLYIKKPFQSEEIFQLALCLTSKWNFEEIQRMRKDWLEILIRCMSKVKMSSGVKISELYFTTLKSVLSFTGASRGFIAFWDESASAWKLENASGVDEAEAAAFVRENSKRLQDSRTTQSFDGKYLLPLKREGYSAVVIIYDVVTQSDPEWYKLLSLLVMTASEVLSNSAQLEFASKKEQVSSIASAMNKVSSEAKFSIDKLISDAEELCVKLRGTPQENDSLKIASSLHSVSRSFDNVLLFNASLPQQAEENIELVSLISSLLKDDLITKNNLSLNVETAVKGVQKAEIKASPSLLRKAFTNILLNSLEAAAAAAKKSVKLSAEISEDASSVVIVFEDDASGIANGIRDRIFESFVSGREHGIGLGLTNSRMIIEKFRGSIHADFSFTQGARFVVRLPKLNA